MPLVFLSYARKDSDPRLDKFVADLTALLKLHTDLDDDDEILFQDVSDIDLGDHWPTQLQRAIATSKAMIAICSPTYFTREFCGKEWELFRRRLTAYAKSQGRAAAPPLILPLLWAPPRRSTSKPLPDVVREIQHAEDFGEIYNTKGLHYIIGLSKHADLYQEILDKIARRILEATEQDPLPDFPEPFTFPSIPSAFGGEAAPSSATQAAAPDSGPGHVQFILVSADRSQVAPLRAKLDAYGLTPTDWCPYFPPHARPKGRVGPLLQRLAADEDFTSHVVFEEDNIAGAVEQALSANNIAVIIVDPWTLRIDVHHERLRDFDGRNFLNSAVLVAWNGSDEETQREADMLETALRATFQNKFAANDTKTFAYRVETMDDLVARLRESLIEVRKRILERAEVVRRAQGRRVFVKPVISAVHSGG
jgi:FxsC-like protein